MDGMYALLALSAGFVFFFSIIGLVFYVLKSYGLYKLAVARNIEYSWLAWIPCGDLYIIGKLIGKLSIASYEIPMIEIVLPAASIISSAFSGVTLIGPLLVIANLILFFFALYKLYKIYVSDKAELWLILSIIFAFLIPIFIFLIKDNRPTEV